MKTNSEREKVLEFLVTPENLDAAWDLAELFPQAIDRLNLKFWKTLGKKLEERIDEKLSWALSQDPENFDEGTADLQIMPEAEPSFYLAPSVWQAIDKKAKVGIAYELPPILFGIGYGDDYSEFPKNERLSKLLDDLAQALKRDGLRRRNSYWLGMKELPNKIRSRQDILVLASGDEIEEEIATMLLNLFEKYRQALEEINATILSCQAKTKPQPAAGACEP
jgi:hypothetical protein